MRLLKLVGAAMIVFGCGGVGFFMARQYRAELTALKQLIHVLDFIKNDLQYRQSPLPELCRLGALQSLGLVSRIFASLAEQLEKNVSFNATECMLVALSLHENVPKRLQFYLNQLGNSLGYFDVNGQIQGITAVREDCVKELSELESQKVHRIRNYQTLGLCAGAALAILLI